MKLLPNEAKLIASNDDTIILTDQRIQLNDKVWGQSYTISLFLEDVSSIELKYKSNIWLVLIGSINIILGIYLLGAGSIEFAIATLVLGVFFLFGWKFTRQHVVSLSSNGGTALDFVVKGMADEKINEFVYNVSLAKQKRINTLYKL